MPLDLSAGAIIRAGSGLVYIAAGLVALHLARTAGTNRRTLLGLGWMAIGIGAFLVPRNILFSSTGVWGVVGMVLGLGAGAVHTVAAACLAYWSRPRPRWWIVAGASSALLVVGPALAARETAFAVGLLPSQALFFAVGNALQGLTVMCVGAWTLAAGSAAREESNNGWLAVAVVAVFAYFEGILGDTAANLRFGPWVALAWGLALLPIVVAGVLHANRGRRVAGFVFMLGPFGYGFLAAVMTLSWPSPDASSFTSPGLGVMRSLAAGVLAYACVRYAGLPQAERGKSRATLAAAALAVLFIVAQITQNFFEANNSLILGSVLAGAFLFAAAPVQRAIERATHKDPALIETQGVRTDVATAARREDVYLNAVRIALHDRHLTRPEEIHLHRLAEELGIGAGRAHELLVAAESERPIKRRRA